MAVVEQQQDRVPLAREHEIGMSVAIHVHELRR
jgi:hypothetical protein